MKKIILCILFIVLSWLFWVNRIHPKIQEAFVAFMAASLTLLGLKLFSKNRIKETKTLEVFITAIAALIAVLLGIIFFPRTIEENIKKEISQVYFNKGGEIIFYNVPILSNYHFQQRLLYGNFTERNPDQAKAIFSDILTNVNCLIELETAALLNHLFGNYSGDWYIKRESKNFPGFNKITGQRLDSKNKDITSFSKEDLQKVFEKNIFYPDISTIPNLKLSLPKGTRIEYQPYTNNNQYCQIRFYKPLYFDVKIKMYFSSYVAGLGNLAYYVGLSKSQKEFTKDNDDKGHGTIIITIECSATFEKIRAGDPVLIRYKEWTKNLFDDLYNTFDWSVCENRIKEYNEALAHQKIVNNL